MITFTVIKNGRKVCTAGVLGDGILTAILSSVPKDQSTGPLTLEVGGLTEKNSVEPYTHVDWCREVLKVGDEVSIRITESDQCDRPIEVRTNPPEEILLEAKKRSALRLCEELGWSIIDAED